MPPAPPVAPDALAALERRLERFFEPGGVLSRAHPSWEPREEQAAMARAVLRTLGGGGHLVVEAGTGTGKTLAYLVPAALLGRRVIISTGTKALQDQLALKDLPFLVETCRLPVSSIVLKGRDNYLCRHRLELFRQQPFFTDRSYGADRADRREAVAWSVVHDWAEETATGDLAEVEGVPEAPGFWREINAAEATCLGSRCPRYDDCHLHVVRRAAHAADLVVVNHHLYLADAATRAGEMGNILPDADLVVFDEAHRLESAATSFFGVSVSDRRMADLAEDVVTELDRARLGGPAVRRRAEELRAAAGVLSGAWGHAAGRRLMPARFTAGQEDVLSRGRGALLALATALRSLGDEPALAPFTKRCADLLVDFEHVVGRSDPTWVHWIESRGRGVALTASPVEVSDLLRENVFSKLTGSVLCSATLAVGGSMGHVRARVGLVESPAAPSPKTDSDTEHDVDWSADRDDVRSSDEDALAPVTELVLESPYDFRAQGLLYLPRGLPDPRSPSWAAACIETIEELVAASRGRAFLLFTSRDAMVRAHEALADALPWPVLLQGQASKREILRRFADEPGSVLFATASFWEGVDVPGEALSLVVIDRLPFAVPSDPLQAARARHVAEAGGDPFRDLSVPEAVLSLKQGVGRLIRSSSDRGVVAILDGRVTGTGYGRRFLRDLPPFRTTRELGDVRDFFAREPVD